MEMSLYFFIGLLIAGLLAYRTNKLTLNIACIYWLVITSWAVGISQPFSFNSINWVPFLHINFDYHIDGLSRLFTFLIAGMGVVVLIYAWLYTQNTPHKRKKLSSLLQLFAISMLGIVLANDMIMLFLCWELTSIISYLLIQFDVNDKEANQAAFNSLFVSVLGGLILLVGFIALNQLSHSWNIHSAITLLSRTEKNQLSLIFYLMLCGAVTKSAQFPFYFWLTGAMKAPTPVSAYLHSATMVNAGIYLLARFHPLFSTLDTWYPLLSAFGLVTLLVSSILSLTQNDLKGILAYTTIFSLGAMIYLLGSKSALPIEAFAIFLLFHGIYKAGAFMLVGIIDKEYHTRQLNKLAGIARHNPSLAISSLIIFAAMAGIPPFFGFTVKEMIYEAKLASPSVSYLFMGISMVSSMFIATTSFRCLWFLFKKNRIVHTKKTWLRLIVICPLFLACLVILFSVFDHTIERFVEPTIQSIITSKQPSYVSPNTTTSFLLSLITSIGGILLFLLSFLIKTPIPNWLKSLELKTAFESLFNGLLTLGKQLTNLTQAQSLTNQLRIFFITIAFILINLLNLHIEQVLPTRAGHTSIINELICCFILLTSFSLLSTRKFLLNLISLSLIGLSVSFFFIANGAVDVAITQLLVEVLTIIILLLALRHTKITHKKESKYGKLTNALTATAFGFIVTHMLFSIKAAHANKQLQLFYAKNSLLAAHGKNIVNVILVDFRSLDTFGEGMVIVATAIGVTLLIKKYTASKREQYVDHH